MLKSKKADKAPVEKKKVVKAEVKKPKAKKLEVFGGCDCSCCGHNCHGDN